MLIYFYFTICRLTKEKKQIYKSTKRSKRWKVLSIKTYRRLGVTLGRSLWNGSLLVTKLSAGWQWCFALIVCSCCSPAGIFRPQASQSLLHEEQGPTPLFCQSFWARRSLVPIFVEAESLAGLLHLIDQLSKAIKEPLHPRSVLQTLLDRLLLPQFSRLHPERCNLQVDPPPKKNK